MTDDGCIWNSIPVHERNKEMAWVHMVVNTLGFNYHTHPSLMAMRDAK